MLRGNVDSGGLGLDIVHEKFLCNRYALLQAFEDWRRPGMIHVAVGAGALMIEMLHTRFPDLQMAVLVRDPIDQLMSMHSHGGRFIGHPTDAGLFQSAGYNWGALEVMLSTAKALNIDARAWHLDYFTTPKGFKDLAQSLGLRLKPDAPHAGPANVCERRVSVEDFSPDVIAALRRMHGQLPLLSKAYSRAKAYADDQMGKQS
jgi:hypothetical protein